MIIGVALVVDDLSKGEKMVFRYPESVPSALFDLSNEALVKFHRDYISFSPDNFAKLFRPKAALANTILDVIIDDLHYISFPCTCAFNASSDVNKDTKAESGISLRKDQTLLVMVRLLVAVQKTGSRCTSASTPTHSCAGLGSTARAA